MRRYYQSFITIVAMCLLAAGCGNQSGGQSASTSAASAPSTATETTTETTASTTPISIGYSDWPGYLVWDICEQQGFFKKHNANVKLVWFPVYTDSLNALAAGKIDANSQTWNDAMGPLAQGVDVKGVLMFDNSWGNDAMIARPGIKTVQDLRGKKVATELGTCDHYLMLKALESAGMTEKDIQYVPMAVQDCPAAMLSKRVDAAVVWEPSRTKILKDMKGSTAVFDSADIPGAIPDLLMMKSSIIESRPDDVQNIVNAWYDAIDWWRKNPDQAVTIMAKRTDTPVADYKNFIKGTRIFSASEGVAAMTKSNKPTSLYTSGQQTADFLMKVKQIDKMPDYAAAVEPKFARAALAKGLGKLPPYNYDVKIALAPPQKEG